MQYNPLLDLVAGIVMILVPVAMLTGFGVWLLFSRYQKPGTLPSAPSKPRLVDEEILRSLELLREHQNRLLEEMRDLSEENQESLRVLKHETEKIRNLLQRETSIAEEESQLRKRNRQW